MKNGGFSALLGNACKGALFSVVLDLHGVAQYGDPLWAGTAFNAYVAVPHNIRHQGTTTVEVPSLTTPLGEMAPTWSTFSA